MPVSLKTSFASCPPALLARLTLVTLSLALVLAACSGPSHGSRESEGAGGDAGLAELRDWDCEASEGSAGAAGATTDPDYLTQIGCETDFDALSSEPLDASIPGARSVKVVFDRLGGDALYFQNSKQYEIHHDFASAYLSGRDGLPLVPPLAEFNRTEYTLPDRRFILGAVTYYEEPEVWALELSPYDTASAEMTETLFDAVENASYFGPRLMFHPTSESVAQMASELPSRIPIVETEDLFGDYQPLNLGVAVGFLRFVEVEHLDEEYVGFQDIVVLDRVPNDISVVMGLITEEFQTPLSHVNVLSQNRGTPNMGLKDATTNPELRAHDGKWVRLEVGAFDWSVSEVTEQEAIDFWEQVRPPTVSVPRFDTDETELKDIELLVTESDDVPLKDAIKAAVPAYGGKASHYSILAKTEGVPTPAAFGIPVHYYDQFMTEHGFYDQVDEIVELTDAKERDLALEELRTEMLEAEVDGDFLDAIAEKVSEIVGPCPDGDESSVRMRFRSSTNAEDLDGFTGAGLYTSRSGDPCDDAYPVEDALREVWSSVWYYRAFEERRYRGIDHKNVGMALLVHHSFPEEEANGVALTANIFDPSGLNPAFYVNVQVGDVSVVLPPPGVFSDQFLLYYTQVGTPASYLSSSNLVAPGSHVLTTAQVHDLSLALEAVHERFNEAYGPAAGNTGFYAMDVEFKFDGPHGEEPDLFLKQARPHPGRGQ